MMKKNTLFWLAALFLTIIVVVGVIYSRSHFSSDYSSGSSPNPTPSLETKPAKSNLPIRQPSASPKPSGLVQSDVPYANLTQPATCQISGKVTFLSHNISQNESADLTYTGIDSPARLIKWQIIPNDALAIGPNLFASIKLPDGKEHIGVVLPERPVASSYKLSASMTYGRLVAGDVKVYEVQCSGQTEVLLNY